MEPAPPRWLNRLAGGTALATLALIAAGAAVTSTDSGMAFRDWPTSAGRNLFTYPWFHDMAVGAWKQVIEHGHRLGATGVGILTLALGFSLWARHPQRGMKVLGCLAAALVVAQGFLGGLRVLFDARLFAFLHAGLAQAFFLVVVAVWALLDAAPAPVRDPLARRRLALAASGLVLAYAQVVLGAAIRQLGFPVRYHAGMALVLAAFLCWVSLSILRAHADVPALRRAATAVAGIVVSQCAFGLTAWLSLRHAAHPRGELGAVSHTVVHVTTGALLLGACLVLALRVRRTLVDA